MRRSHFRKPAVATGTWVDGTTVHEPLRRRRAAPGRVPSGRQQCNGQVIHDVRRDSRTGKDEQDLFERSLRQRRLHRRVRAGCADVLWQQRANVLERRTMGQHDGLRRLWLASWALARASAHPQRRLCSANAVETCSSSGQFDTGADCTNQACVDGTCTGVCTPGTKTCDALIPQTCNAKGVWLNATANGAHNVCSVGVRSGTCKPGAKKCNGQNNTCDSGGHLARRRDLYESGLRERRLHRRLQARRQDVLEQRRSRVLEQPDSGATHSRAWAPSASATLHGRLRPDDHAVRGGCDANVLVEWRLEHFEAVHAGRADVHRRRVRAVRRGHARLRRFAVERLRAIDSNT